LEGGREGGEGGRERVGFVVFVGDHELLARLVVERAFREGHDEETSDHLQKWGKRNESTSPLPSLPTSLPTCSTCTKVIVGLRSFFSVFTQISPVLLTLG